MLVPQHTSKRGVGSGTHLDTLGGPSLPLPSSFLDSIVKNSLVMGGGMWDTDRHHAAWIWGTGLEEISGNTNGT